jgi:predicted nucleotidyltransferase
MPPLRDPRLVEIVAALANGLEHAGVRYCLIGALVPELLLKTPPSRRTNDADVVVLVETLDEFDRVKGVLERPTYGFARTAQPFRMSRAT